MAIEADLAALRARHAELKERISQAVAQPLTDDLAISEMKREKLAIKDEIAQLEAAQQQVA